MKFNVLKYTFPILKRYKWSLISAIVLFMATVVVDSILKNYYLSKIIDTIVDNPNVPHIILQKSLMNFVFLSAGALIVGYALSRFSSWAVNHFENNLLRELNNDAFVRITTHSYTFFSNNFAGALVSKVKRFTSGFKFIFHQLIVSFLPAFTIFLFAFLVILFKAPIIAYILGIWFVLYISVILWFIKKKYPHDVKKASMDSRVGGRFADVFTNILNLKIFSAREKEEKYFFELTKEEAKYRGYSWFLGNQQRAIKAAFMVLIQILVLYLEIKLWVKGDISTGTIVLVQTYIISIFGRLWDLDEMLGYFIEYVADIKETIDIFNIKPDVLDLTIPEKNKISVGEINFKSVSFEYIEDDEVFNDFNLLIPSGQKIGLVGHSGSGKSTITKLLLRFSDVKSGSILIDGQDISKITQDDLRSVISYVPQEPILFHRTIKENIAYSKPDATEEEITSAAKKAHAHEFIIGLQNGYDTLVGERGVKLSGGERQRVAIARAMLKTAPILLLDEATSSLDSISESYIQEAFNELMKSKTTIVIAHRLSTIQKMDRIIVLDKGKIVEEGTHKELLAQNGFYADLWNHQTGGFIE